jgi:hypothetical protein
LGLSPPQGNERLNLIYEELEEEGKQEEFKQH